MRNGLGLNVFLFLTCLIFVGGTSSAFEKTALQQLRSANQCSGCDLSKVDLKWPNLSGANLRRTDLSKADLVGANLNEADLRWVDLSDSDLRTAQIVGALFCETLTPWREDNSGCDK